MRAVALLYLVKFVIAVLKYVMGYCIYIWLGKYNWNTVQTPFRTDSTKYPDECALASHWCADLSILIRATIMHMFFCSPRYIINWLLLWNYFSSEICVKIFSLFMIYSIIVSFLAVTYFYCIPKTYIMKVWINLLMTPIWFIEVTLQFLEERAIESQTEI